MSAPGPKKSWKVRQFTLAQLLASGVIVATPNINPGVPTSVHLSCRDESSFVITVISNKHPILQLPIRVQHLVELRAQGVPTTSDTKGFVFGVGPLLDEFEVVATQSRESLLSNDSRQYTNSFTLPNTSAFVAPSLLVPPNLDTTLHDNYNNNNDTATYSPSSPLKPDDNNNNTSNRIGTTRPLLARLAQVQISPQLSPVPSPPFNYNNEQGVSAAVVSGVPSEGRVVMAQPLDDDAPLPPAQVIATVWDPSPNQHQHLSSSPNQQRFNNQQQHSRSASLPFGSKRPNLSRLRGQVGRVTVEEQYEEDDNHKTGDTNDADDNNNSNSNGDDDAGEGANQDGFVLDGQHTDHGGHNLASILIQIAKEFPEVAVDGSGPNERTIPSQVLEAWKDTLLSYPLQQRSSLTIADPKEITETNMDLSGGARYVARKYAPAIMGYVCYQEQRDTVADARLLSTAMKPLTTLKQGSMKHGQAFLSRDGSVVVRCVSHSELDVLTTHLPAYLSMMNLLPPASLVPAPWHTAGPRPRSDADINTTLLTDNDNVGDGEECGEQLMRVLPRLLGLYEVQVTGMSKFGFVMLDNSMRMMPPRTDGQWQALNHDLKAISGSAAHLGALSGVLGTIAGVSVDQYTQILRTISCLTSILTLPSTKYSALSPLLATTSYSSPQLASPSNAQTASPNALNSGGLLHKARMSLSMRIKGPNEVDDDQARLTLIVMDCTPPSLPQLMSHTSTRLEILPSNCHKELIQQDDVLVIGGMDERGNFNRVVYRIRFALSAGTTECSISCEPLPDKACLPTGLCSHSAVATKHGVFVFGGSNEKGITNHLLCFDLANVRWRFVSTKHSVPPAPRCGHSACLMRDDQMVVFGGLSPRGHSQDLYVLQIDKGCRWLSPEVHVTNGIPPHPREGHSMTALDKETAILIGGGTRKDPYCGDACLLRSAKRGRVGFDMDVIQGDASVRTKGLCAHDAAAVRVGGYGLGHDHSIKGVLVVGGDTMGNRKQAAEFLDTQTLRMPEMDLIGCPLLDLTQHSVFSAPDGECSTSVFVIGGISAGGLSHCLYRLVLAVPMARQDQVRHFVMSFKAAPPPLDVRVSVYHKFLQHRCDTQPMLVDDSQDTQDPMSFLGPMDERLLEELFELLWECCETETIRSQDSTLGAKIAALAQFVTPEHLEIKRASELGAPWTEAQGCLAAMKHARSPFAKMRCVMDCCKAIGRHLGSQASADDFLPVLIFASIHAQVPSIFSEIEFIQVCGGPFVRGEQEYYLTQLWSAVLWLSSLQRSHLKVTDEEVDKYLTGVLTPEPGENDGDGSGSDQDERGAGEDNEQAGVEREEQWWMLWEPEQRGEGLILSHDKAHMAGVLDKRGFINTSWKTRFVTLHNNVLAYYESAAETNPKGVIRLRRSLIYEYGGGNSGKFGFEIHVPGRIFVFRTTERATAHEWVAAIQKHSTCQRGQFRDYANSKRKLKR